MTESERDELSGPPERPPDQNPDDTPFPEPDIEEIQETDIGPETQTEDQ